MLDYNYGLLKKKKMLSIIKKHYGQTLNLS